MCHLFVLFRIFFVGAQSGGLTAEEFKQAIQEAANFPLRPYVLPFLKSHIPLLQRDIVSLAKANNQVSSKMLCTHTQYAENYVYTKMRVFIE